MRAVLLTQILVALYVSAAVEAQSVRQPKPTAPVKPPAGTTFTGCLTETKERPKGYELTVTSVSEKGTTPASTVYRLMPVATGVNLAEHVGHRVTITGSQTGAAQGNETSRGTNKQPLQVRVTDVHHIAPDCK
jgi:hypothetical protein